MIRLLFLWGPALGMMAVIFAASSVPNLTSLPGGVSDHAGHFAGYALLSALLIRAIASARWAGVTWPASAAAVALSALYGVSDEWHQRFVPGRTAALDDWIADLLGAATAAGLLAGVASVVRRRERRAV